jgi:hypothetical protein
LKVNVNIYCNNTIKSKKKFNNSSNSDRNGKIRTLSVVNDKNILNNNTTNNSTITTTTTTTITTNVVSDITTRISPN